MNIIEDNRYEEAFNRLSKNDTQKVFTPPRLIRRVLSKINFKPSDKILVWYNVEFLIYLVREVGLSPQNIYIYTNTDNKLVLEKNGYNVIHQQNIDLDEDNIIFNTMKFNVIIGNPPFESNQDRKAKGNKIKGYKQPLWPLFVKKSLDLIDENGFLAFITPMSWMAGTYDIRKGRIYLLKEMTNKFSLKYCNFDSENLSKQYFNGVGSTFSFFITKKEMYDGQTIVENKYGSSIMDLSEVKSLPLDPHPLKVAVNSKTINKNNQKFTFQSVSFQPQGSDVKEPTLTHTIKGYCNGGQMGNVIFSYWQTPDKYFGMKKVLIGKTDRSYLPFVDYEGLNIGQNQLWFMKLNEEDNYETAVQVFNHPLFKFLIQCNKHGAGPETHLVYSLPFVDLTKFYTTEDIYDLFDITEEEKNYIEENV